LPVDHVSDVCELLSPATPPPLLPATPEATTLPCSPLTSVGALPEALPEPANDDTFAPEVVKPTDSIDPPSICESPDIEPAVETWSALGLLGRLFRKHPSFVDVCANLSSPIASPHRHRELFPLPIIPRDYLFNLPDVSALLLEMLAILFLG
jgi:hypothetical protein